MTNLKYLEHEIIFFKKKKGNITERRKTQIELLKKEKYTDKVKIK